MNASRLRFSPPAWGWSYPRDAAQVGRALENAGKVGGVTYLNKEKTRQWLARNLGFNRPQYQGPLTGHPYVRTDAELGQGRFATGDYPVNQSPRQFGQQLKDAPDISDALKFSPPAWGWSDCVFVGAWLPVVFPTRVGMVRMSAARPDMPVSFPHPRGDGPGFNNCRSGSVDAAPGPIPSVGNPHV